MPQANRERERERERERVVLPRRDNFGFTLIELLVVIAIIAILAVVVVLTLNPAELLKQSRDANRLSDLATMNSAINLYATDQGGATNFSLGSSTLTYLSTPDPTATTTAGTNCAGLGFSLAGFWCPASSTFRNVDGTGWIPINFTSMTSGPPFGSLPIDPVNQTSSDLYYSYQTKGTTFRLVADPESQKDATAAGANPTMFVSGSNPTLDGGSWVLVPENSSFGTGNFYVMKYDASCETTGQTPLASPLNGTAVNGYDNSSQNCSIANGYVPVSLPTGYPIVEVTESQAAQYCANIGANLITNNEWQTIAWNAENQGTNWYGGVVGTNYIYSGHNDGVPNYVSIPSSNDTQNCIGTDGPASCGGTGSANSQIRTLTLSNGSILWDMAGNIWQWTNSTITGTNEPHGSASSWNWSSYSAVTTWGAMTQQTAGAANSTLNSASGIGWLFSENATDGATYGVIRGGQWSNSGFVGVEGMDLDNATSYLDGATGFRCAR